MIWELPSRPMQTRISNPLSKLIFSVVLVIAIGLHVGVLRAAEVSTHQPLIRGPFFIAIVYPVLDVRADLTELVELIPEAYSFWGKMIISTTDHKAYSPGPFSYPYRYTQRGLIRLERELKGNSEVIPGSLQVKTFPNIPKEQQDIFQAAELSQILKQERYLSFRLKRWNDIELMAFPTFIVLTFDYTKRLLRSSSDYETVKSRFSEVVSDFVDKEELRSILGISRKKQPWANVPVLTFTAIDSYSENVIRKIYLNGPIEPDEARQVFLQHASVHRLPTPITSSDPLVTHCDEFGLEMSSFSHWRLYYTGLPLFHHDAFGQRIDPFHLYGPRGVQSRILRTALFVNVTLPTLLKVSGKTLREIEELSQRITDTRRRLFNEFTDKIDELNEPIAAAVDAVQNKIAPTLQRLEEASVGYDGLIAALERPFVPPTRRDSRTAKNDSPDICLRLFDFEHRSGLQLNDRLKSKAFMDDIRANLILIQRGKDTLSNELTNAMSLLETRRNLIWARNNSQLTLETAQENARLTMENAQTNARLTMNNALLIALISFILIAVSNIAIQIWLRHYDEIRQRKRRDKEIELNRRHGDGI